VRPRVAATTARFGNAVLNDNVNIRRLYFAIWPDEPMRRSLESARQHIFPLSGRAVEAANLHLTLAFLGAVPAAQVPAIKLLSGPIKPIQIELDCLELWVKRRVLVARASQVPHVLVHQLDLLWQRLDRLGFKRDPRPFKPHVTLARDIKSVRDGLRWTPVSWHCEWVQLMESLATPSGTTYLPVS
jgi:RNA 2',3'-cyclic 3'-phosphodiesterase